MQIYINICFLQRLHMVWTSKEAKWVGKQTDLKIKTNILQLILKI